MSDLHKRVLSVLVAVSTLLALPSSAFAFSDDFEDGNYDGWFETILPGGSGSCGVESHNGSQMAFCKHVGPGGQHSLSKDFPCSSAEILSFDMQAVAVLVADGARAGVAVSFLTGLNIPLGAVGLYNVTGLSWLPANSYAVDNGQHHYQDTMASFASLAGLDPANSAIAELRIDFQSTPGSNWCCEQPSASAWFDNVNVPEPGTSALVLAGLAMVAVGARRRRSAS